MPLPNNFFNHDAQAGGFFNVKSHVGFDLSGFGQSQNMLIEGIRGTGKTHVLKMVESNCLDNFETLRVLPIFFSLASISEHTQKPPHEFRQYLYSNIVQSCIEAVERNRTHLQTDRTLRQKAIESITKLFGFQSEPDFEHLLSKLKKTAEDLHFKLQYDRTSIDDKESHTNSESTSAGVSSKLSANQVLVQGELKSNATNTLSAEKEVERTVSYVGNLLSHQDATRFIIDFLNEIQVILNLNHSLVLIDECSEASPPAQTEIFRLFKAIRGSRSKLPGKDTSAFFIGSVYPRGNTYYPTRNNDGFEFQPGQDCTMEFLQWDETDIDTYFNFFKEMILARAVEVLKYPKSFQDFLYEYFDDPEAFGLAVYCANGIPRRFWEILKTAYDKGSGKILLRGVDFAVQEITNNQILASNKLTSSDITTVEYITETLVNKNSRIREKNNQDIRGRNAIPQNIYFSVARDSTVRLNNLIMEGVIHDKSRMRTSHKRSRSQPMYSLDISIVYMNRVIPQKTFVQSIKNDVPRCSSRNYDQAPEIQQDMLENLYAISRNSEEGLPTIQKTGVVKLFPKNRRDTGKLLIEGDRTEALFRLTDIQDDQRTMIRVGYRVQFLVNQKSGGFRAHNIQLAEQKGKVQTINVRHFGRPSFGFIEMKGVSFSLYFSWLELDSEARQHLKVGDMVTFDIGQNDRGNCAIKISIAEENPSPSNT